MMFFHSSHNISFTSYFTRIYLIIYIYIHIIIYVYMHLFTCCIHLIPLQRMSLLLRGSDSSLQELKQWAEENREWSELGTYRSYRRVSRCFRAVEHHFQGDKRDTRGMVTKNVMLHVLMRLPHAFTAVITV